MKKLVILWISSIFYLATFGQGSEYFNKILQSFPGSSSISTGIQSDSNYLLVIDNVLPGQPQNTIYLLVNKFGNILDSAQFTDTFKISAVFPGNTAIKTTSGKYIVCTNRTGTNYHDYGYLVCLNLNLDTLWTRTFTHPDTAAISQPNADVFNIITAIRQTWDGGFIITGNYTKNCIQGNVRSYLLKTDSMGVMQWIKKYDNVGKVYDVQITQDSGFVFSNLLVGFSITKTNSLGEIQWQLKPNNDAHLASSAIALTSDNCVIYASPHQYDLVMGTPLFGIDICKVRLSDKAVLWNKKYNVFTSFECHSLHQAFTIQTNSDNSIVVGGTALVYNAQYSPASEYKGVMMKLTPNGDSIWARYYSYGAFTDVGQFERMITTDDGGFLAVGYYLPIPPPAGTGSMPWLVKMDSLGCDTPGCQYISIEGTGDRRQVLEIFPNPFGEEMQVELPKEFFGGILVLYDVQGRRAVETFVSKGYTQQTFTVQTPDLKPGVYLVELAGKDGRVWRRKAVKK